MSKRLFVDCDDTLIIYDAPSGDVHPYGLSRGEPYTVNMPLAHYVRTFREDRPHALVVVWSGGGADYARTVADMALPGVDVAAMAKNETTFGLVRPQDIVVDDQDIWVQARVYGPDEWVYDGVSD